MIVLAIPMHAVLKLPPDLFERTPEGAFLVDTANYYPDHRDGPIDALEAGMVESLWVSQWIGRPVLKAFNNIGTPSLAGRNRPRGAADRIALSVAGDDEAAKARLLALIEAIGFDGVDTGPLSESWRQEPGTPAYCHDWNAFRMRAALIAADPDHRPFYRHEAQALVRTMHGLLAAAPPAAI